MDNGSQHTSEPSVAALLGGIVSDGKELLVQELALTKLEVHDTLRKARTAAMALGLGIGVVAIGGISLMLMLVQVLAAFTEIPLWGCYGIVGGAWSSWVRCCSLWANARPRPSTWCLSGRLRP